MTAFSLRYTPPRRKGSKKAISFCARSQHYRSRTFRRAAGQGQKNECSTLRSFSRMATYPKTQKHFAKNALISLFNADVAEVQLIYSHKVKAAHRPQIQGSVDAERILRNAWQPGTMDYKESFYILLLDRSNRVLGVAPISQGGISGTVADPKVIFSAALLANASAVILSHYVE